MIEASKIKTAQERRLTAFDTEQLKGIEEEILRVSNETFDNYIYWDGNISEKNMKELRSAGYIVTYCNFQDGNDFRISW